MANGAADPNPANAELRRLLRSSIGKAKRAASDDREWWSTEIDTLCEKMAPLWRACGIETPGIWTDGGNKLHPSPVACIHLKTLDPDTQAVRGTILQSGQGEDAYNAPARAVVELMDVAERWIDWLELRDVAVSPALSEVSKNTQRPLEAASLDALRGDLESLRANFGRLFSMEVRAVVQSSREYWPSRYREPRGPQLAPEPPGEWRRFRFVTGQGMAVKPRGPRSAEEADKAETFYANGEAIVDALGKPLITVQGWAEDNLTFCVGPGADRFMETLDLANRIVSMHASILAPILFDDSSGVTFCAHAWPSIVNRVAEIAGRATLRPPVWKVSNGQTSWTVRAWKQRDKVGLSRPIYSPADVELIGAEPETVYADRETIIRDSESALDWLIEKLQAPPTTIFPAESLPDLHTLRDRLDALATRFRAVDAQNENDGDYYVQRLSAAAGKLAKRMNDAGLLRYEGQRAGKGSHPWPNDDASIDEWAAGWLSFTWGELRLRCPERITDDVGCLRWEEQVPASPDGLGIRAIAPQAGDWRERARDYADACELLAEWCEMAVAEERAAVDSTSNGRQAGFKTSPEPPLVDFGPELDAVLSLRQRQVFYQQNPDLPPEFFEGKESEVGAELGAAGIEYEGAPLEWLRSMWGHRMVERRFRELLEEPNTAANGLTPQVKQTDVASPSVAPRDAGATKRQGRLPKEESAIRRTRFLAELREHPTMKDDPAKLAAIVGISDSTARRWLKAEKRKFLEFQRRQPEESEDY